MSVATDSNSGKIYMINRDNYRSLTDEQIDSNSIYLVRENSKENCKFISMYLGKAIQADVLDITDDITYDEVNANYNIPVCYQVENKFYLHKDGDHYRVFSWNKEENRYIDCLGAVDTSQFVTKDEHGNVVITGTLESGDFTSTGTIHSNGDISSGGTLSTTGNITSGQNVISSTGASLTTRRDSVSGTPLLNYTDSCLPANGYEVLISNDATEYAEIADIEISDVSTMRVGASTTSRSNDYSCTYIFRKAAATTTAEALMPNFTSTNETETTVSDEPPKINLLNPDLDISSFNVIHIFIFYDGISMCAIVGGYNHTFPVQP